MYQNKYTVYVEDDDNNLLSERCYLDPVCLLSDKRDPRFL